MEVVIVDDDPVNLSVYAGLMERISSAHTRSFEDPEEALGSCRLCEPDLIIVDYMMPRMNGVEFIQRVRSVSGWEELPIVMVTSSQERSVRHRALEVGATDFLSKPVDAQEFLVRVSNMLKLRHAYVRLADRAENLAAEVARATERIRTNERDTLYALGRAAEYRDPETGAHILRMARYTCLIARQLGLPPEEQDLLLQAAPLHDLGKIGTPDQILLKPGALTGDEWNIMKKHTTIGWQILRSHVSPILQAGAIIAHSHHEKYDGSGYPLGLAGEQIPAYGRMVAVADVFDALTSVRPYKTAWPVERARAYLEEGRGSHFEPRCVDSLLQCWPEVEEIMRDHPG